MCFGLATVTLIFLLIITLLGTLDQVENGLPAQTDVVLVIDLVNAF